MNDPIISIIIPIYNVEMFLYECLDCIARQSYTDFELILINDGSQDNSGAICDEFASKDPRIRVIHQTNSGVSRARNAGLAIARGEWVTFIDSDDWVDPEFLEQFRIEDAEDCDLICQGLKYIVHNTKTELRRIVFDNSSITIPDSEQQLKKYNILGFGVTVCKCFKRSIIEKYEISFDEKIAYHEDHLFTLEYIAHSRRIVTTIGCGYNYRFGHNPNSLSKKKHSWQSQELASRKMIKSLNNICTVYNIDGTYYSRMMSFCLGPKIKAAAQVYKENISNDTKKSTMLAILTPLTEISKHYFPSSRQYKPIRKLAKDKSGLLLHLYFLICSKIWK